MMTPYYWPFAYAKTSYGIPRGYDPPGFIQRDATFLFKQFVCFINSLQEFRVGFQHVTLLQFKGALANSLELVRLQLRQFAENFRCAHTRVLAETLARINTG